MRHTLSLTVAVLASALALGGCGKAEVKTGSLTQRFTMMDGEGRNFGLVELDPVSGGKLYDAQGRIVGHIVPPAPANYATLAMPETAVTQ